MGGWASRLASVSQELDSGFSELRCVFLPLVNLLADDVSCLSCGLRVSLETLALLCDVRRREPMGLGWRC